VETDRGVALRVLELFEAVLRDPSRELASPSHYAMNLLAPGLEGLLKSIGSFTRIVYRVRGTRIDLLQAGYHY
jgi:Txe/YoeB family toxin of Txe-Axe toxin-antitoxin module